MSDPTPEELAALAVKRAHQTIEEAAKGGNKVAKKMLKQVKKETRKNG